MVHSREKTLCFAQLSLSARKKHTKEPKYWQQQITCPMLLLARQTLPWLGHAAAGVGLRYDSFFHSFPGKLIGHLSLRLVNVYYSLWKWTANKEIFVSC
jgi:hypothetical protein